MTESICTVTAAALVVSVLMSLAGHGSMRALVKLVAGVFMALTLISPLMKLEFPDINTWMHALETDGYAAAQAGAGLAEDARRTIIKERTQAYILDKAARYGAALEVDVTVNKNGIPDAVTLTGSISPYAKAAISRELSAELGMEEEMQRWISTASVGG